MSDYIKGVQVGNEVKQYDYDALGNKPNLVEVDATLSESGKAADAKVVGDGIRNSAVAIKGNTVGSTIKVTDVSPVKHNLSVDVYSKNILPYGTITFTKNKSYNLTNPIPAGTYTFSAEITSDDTDNTLSSLSINHGAEVLKYIPFNRGKRVNSTFTVEKPITTIDFCAGYNYAQGEGDSATWANIQLESGSSLTDYSDYVDPSTISLTYGGNTYTPTSDGEVDGLVTTSTTVEMSVPDGFNIYLEYNQDTTTVIKKLTNAIAALGGTV